MKPYHAQHPRPTSITERQPVNRKDPIKQSLRPMNHDLCVVTFCPTRSLSASGHIFYHLPLKNTRHIRALLFCSPLIYLQPHLPSLRSIPSMPPPSRQNHRPHPLFSLMRQLQTRSLKNKGAFASLHPLLNRFLSPLSSTALTRRLHAIIKTLSKPYLALSRVLFHEAKPNNPKQKYSISLFTARLHWFFVPREIQEGETPLTVSNTR